MYIHIKIVKDEFLDYAGKNLHTLVDYVYRMWPAIYVDVGLVILNVYASYLYALIRATTDYGLIGEVHTTLLPGSWLKIDACE